MNDSPINFSRQFAPTGLAGETVAPMNVDEDSPPGAGGYASGPLANMPPRPSPSPTPAPQSLSTLAAGGYNHAELWMSGQQAAPQQAPFPTKLSDMSSAFQPTVPKPKVNPDDLSPFGWSSAFSNPPSY